MLSQGFELGSPKTVKSELGSWQKEWKAEKKRTFIKCLLSAKHCSEHMASWARGDLILQGNQLGKYYYYPHFDDKETET